MARHRFIDNNVQIEIPTETLTMGSRVGANLPQNDVISLQESVLKQQQ